MKNKKKLYILIFNILAIALFAIYIALFLLMEDFPYWGNLIFFIVALGFIIFFRIFLGKQAKVEAEAMKKEEEIRKEKFLSILEEKKDFTATASVMLELITHQNIEIEQLLQKNNLCIDFDFVEEDNYYDVMIDSVSTRKKDAYYLSLCLEGELMLNSGNVIFTNNMKDQEIIEHILKDLQEYQEILEKQR